jgi:membrane-associated phospholipid phosphatase
MLSQLDLILFQALNSHAGNPLVDRVIGAICNPMRLGLLLVAPYWYFWFTTRAPAIRREVGAGLIGAILAIAICRATANFLPYRERPMYDLDSGFVALGHALPPGYLEHWSSFPSDTIAFLLALAMGLYLLARRLSIALMIVAIIAGGVGRVYLGIHYPFDIAVGMVVAMLSVLAAHQNWAVRLVDGALRWERIAPAPFYLLAIVATTEMSQMFDTVRKVGREAFEVVVYLLT